MELSLIFIAVTAQLHLPPNLLSSICYIESRHVATAIHHDDGGSDSIGLCQIKHKTAKWMGFKGNEKDLLDPKINAYYAGKYLKYLLKRYDNNTIKAVIAYNIGNTRSLTTTNYQRKVFNKWKPRRAR